MLTRTPLTPLDPEGNRDARTRCPDHVPRRRTVGVGAVAVVVIVLGTAVTCWLSHGRREGCGPTDDTVRRGACVRAAGGLVAASAGDPHHARRELDERPPEAVPPRRRVALLLPLQRRLSRRERHGLVPRDLDRSRALEDQGVAIEKYANGLGDIWTGTAVVDENGTAGFGAGAVIALVTQQVDGVQRQSLFFSRDGGYSFESYDGNPVMDNPGVADWRDPRVFWDDAAGHWVMALAEHDRIGFYTSPNLREWTYTSDFVTAGLGVLECPDLFPMSVDGDPDDVRWVLVAGANGAAEGMTTGTAYWVGEWDGERFAADGTGHQWLDHGPDYYAAVTWDDPRLAERASGARYGIGWMNNWAYAGRFPAEDWQGGSDSIVRTIPLGSDGGERRCARRRRPSSRRSRASRSPSTTAARAGGPWSWRCRRPGPTGCGSMRRARPASCA